MKNTQNQQTNPTTQNIADQNRSQDSYWHEYIQRPLEINFGQPLQKLLPESNPIQKYQDERAEYKKNNPGASGWDYLKYAVNPFANPKDYNMGEDNFVKNGEDSVAIEISPVKSTQEQELKGKTEDLSDEGIWQSVSEDNFSRSNSIPLFDQDHFKTGSGFIGNSEDSPV